MPDETTGINNAVSCYKAAVQFSASFVTSLLVRFLRNLWNGNGFCIFFDQLTLIKIANTALDMSAALALRVINWAYCSCSGICQIQQQIWPEPALAGFSKRAGFPICLSQNPVQPYWISLKWPVSEPAGNQIKIRCIPIINIGPIYGRLRALTWKLCFFPSPHTY